MQAMSPQERKIEKNKERLLIRGVLFPPHVCFHTSNLCSHPKEVLSAPEYGDVVRVITEPVAYEKFLELVSQHQSAVVPIVLDNFCQ